MGAPVLSFTAEEIWENLPDRKEDSVMLAEWYTDFPQTGASLFDDEFWDDIIKAKEAVNGALEKALRFILITSGAEVKDFDDNAGDATELDSLRVAVTASEHEKCERCWHHTDDVGADEKHPTLCGRCVENVEGDGEVRRFG